MIEILDPQYARTALEALRLLTSAAASLASRVGFDDSSRLRVRAEYLDDGYVRVRDASGSIDILEILREMSWTFYNLSQQRRLLENLDVALSTRASESTLSAIAGALASRATDKLRVSVVDALPLSPANLTQVSGTALTGRDWSSDFAKLQNLDVALSTRASESTLSALSGKFPSAAALADNLSNPTTTVIGSALLAWDGTYWRRVAADASSRLRVVAESVANPSNLDVALSTRASESTLSAIAGALASKATDKLRVSVVDALPLSPINLTQVSGTSLTGRDWSSDFAKLQNLDVALSTRASESTLSSLSGKFPSAAALADNLSNPTTTIVGSALLGWDGTYWRRVAVDASSRLRVVAESVANPPNLDRSLSKAAQNIIGVEVGLSGYDAVYPSFDDTQWSDTTTRTVTETSWTGKTRFRLRMRSLPHAGYYLHVVVRGYVAASGQTMYVRVRGWQHGTLATFTFTETAATLKEARAYFDKVAWWEDVIAIEAYVAASGQTGYITAVVVNLVPALGLAYGHDAVSVRPTAIAADATARALRVSDYYVYNPGGAETFTTTPLGAGAAYYGPTRDFLYSRLTTFGVMGYANQPSATDGVYVQLSLDGSNWDYRGATTTLTAAGAVSLAQVVTARYARAVWVNGGTAQTAFRLGGRYMISGSENPPLSLAPPAHIEAVCSACGRDMSETGDFFVEDNKVHCPKCYANKRWKEVRDRAEWVRSLKAWMKTAREGESARVKDHAPDGFLEVVG